MLPLCRAAGVPFCVNDRLDVALAVGADVVHLGQDDLPLADAQRVRAVAGRPDLLIGFSTHNLAQALAAAAGGADYIGFGPVFGTRSKLNPDPTVGLEALAEVCGAVAVPVVAIGGITLDGRASRRARGRLRRRDHRRHRGGAADPTPPPAAPVAAAFGASRALAAPRLARPAPPGCAARGSRRESARNVFCRRVVRPADFAHPSDN